MDMKARAFLVAALAMALTACPRKGYEAPMTAGEASQALEESSLDSQAAALTANSVEISTSFTIGSAVEQAAAEIQTFVETQLPCAGVTLEGARLSITYGKKPGNCVYRGQTYQGTHTIEVKKTAPGEIEVDHAWAGFSNQRVKVDGTAQVTWSASAQSRRIQHELTWTRLIDGRTGKGSGDRTQTPLAGGLAEGIKVDGTRSWAGAQGTWDLAVRGVEMRWNDPVPQSGSYTLGSPSGRSMNMAFQRIDADTIRVTVSSGDRSFNLDVNALGQVQSEG
jgi:hypothetical protein